MQLSAKFNNSYQFKILYEKNSEINFQDNNRLREQKYLFMTRRIKCLSMIKFQDNNSLKD